MNRTELHKIFAKWFEEKSVDNCVMTVEREFEQIFLCNNPYNQGDLCIFESEKFDICKFFYMYILSPMQSKSKIPEVFSFSSTDIGYKDAFGDITEFLSAEYQIISK